MRISFELETDYKQLYDFISTSFKDIVKAKARSINAAIKAGIKDIVRRYLENQPEYISLTSFGGINNLQAIFGFNDGERRINAIINRILENINCELVANNNTIYFRIILIDVNYDDLIKMPSSNVVIDNGSLPWLEWLLTKGTDILIYDHQVKIGPFPQSRSGMAVMQEKTGATFSVPPEYAGTYNNNFITRAVEQSIPDIELLVKNTITKVLL